MSESDSAELRRRLKKLGRRKRSSDAAQPRMAEKWISLPDGHEVETSLGPAFLIKDEYERNYEHGKSTLSSILSFPVSLAAEISGQHDFENVPLEEIAFLDTETTGLGGGAGTLIFLVGIGTFEGKDFRFHQYFLRDPSEEPGMLDLLQSDLESASAFVTYNGRAFDLPLLESRYTIALQRRLALLQVPHLDLLHVARRLWRHSLPDCTLGTVEAEILGVERTEEDVPGAWIPGMYLDFLRSGDASEMTRVIYHNAIDVLSLVGLAGHVLDRHTEKRLQDLNPSEALAVARWHQESGRVAPAEIAYKKAMSSRNKELKVEAIRRFTAYLKREGRRSDAVRGWQRWHRILAQDPIPCVELAKYYEWHVRDYPKALHWAQEALQCLTHWPADWRRDQAWEQIEHRIARLQRKIESQVAQR